MPPHLQNIPYSKNKKDNIVDFNLDFRDVVATVNHICKEHELKRKHRDLHKAKICYLFCVIHNILPEFKNKHRYHYLVLRNHIQHKDYMGSGKVDSDGNILLDRCDLESVLEYM